MRDALRNKERCKGHRSVPKILVLIILRIAAALLLKEWRGYGNQSVPGGSYAGSGRYVYENFEADTGEGYGYSSEAQPMYSWGA